MNNIPRNQQALYLEDDAYGQKPSLVSEINSAKIVSSILTDFKQGE